MENIQHISLGQLQTQIKESIDDRFMRALWVSAEILDISTTPVGHCYLTLVEKDEISDNVLSKIQAIIWAASYRVIRPYFETTIGEPMQTGMKVLLQVKVQYSPIYGLSLVVMNIDPGFTIGVTALERQKTLERLEKEGMLDMNRSLLLPDLPHRFAVISSETAAGYGDFMNHLHSNPFGYHFETKLFISPMQSSEAPAGIISALDAIACKAEHYDAVLILRGGGSTFDLSCFDDYELAVNIAQFPLPVLTAIGHERDCHVADIVAYQYLKTPTALADYFVDIFATEEHQIDSLANRLLMAIKGKRADAVSAVDRMMSSAQNTALLRINSEKRIVDMLIARSSSRIISGLQIAKAQIDMLMSKIRAGTSAILRNEVHKIDLLELRIASLNPFSIMEKGFAMVVKDGKKLSSVTNLSPEDSITVLFQDGNANCDVKTIKNN